MELFVRCIPLPLLENFFIGRWKLQIDVLL
jgi:hypothetical protein